MRRTLVSLLYVGALAHAVFSVLALHALWREVAGVDPVSTYAGLPFLILAFPWVFLAALLPGAFGPLIGVAAGAALNSVLICLAARRLSRRKARSPSASA